MPLIDMSSLSPELRKKVRQACLLSCEEILELSDIESLRKGFFKDEEIVFLQRLAANEFDIHLNPVAELGRLKDNTKITLDCDVINELLGGGVAVRGITELVGESGAGKTQFCLQLAITTQYPLCHAGLASGVVYICTEDKFPSNRLMQMLDHFPRSQQVSQATSHISFTDNIFIDHISDLESLQQCVSHRLPHLLSSNNIGLIIIDSIAAVFASEYSLKESVARGEALREVGLQLHLLNRRHAAPVVCVNQVRESVVEGEDQEKRAALGLVWANLVTTRLRVTRFPSRTLSVVWSPELPRRCCHYDIRSSGIHGTHGSPSVTSPVVNPPPPA